MAKPLFSRSAIAYRSLSGAVLLCLGLLIWDTQNPQTLQPVRSLLHQITSPASSLGAFFNQNTNQIGANLKSRQELYRENLSLKAELAAANLYLQQNAQQASELAQLSGIYTRPLQLPGSVQLAGVVIIGRPERHSTTCPSGICSSNNTSEYTAILTEAKNHAWISAICFELALINCSTKIDSTELIAC